MATRHFNSPERFKNIKDMFQINISGKSERKKSEAFSETWKDFKPF